MLYSEVIPLYIYVYICVYIYIYIYIYIYTYFLKIFFSIMVYHRMWNIVLCALQEDLGVYPRNEIIWP